MTRKTGVIYDERCVAHNPPGGLPAGGLPGWAAVPAFERPERLIVTRRMLDESGILGSLTALEPRFATAAELELAHSPEHVQRILAAAQSGELTAVGSESWTGPGSYDALRLAAGGLLVAVDAVLGGALDNAFALLRPPGHHAERDTAMGYCLVNNVAIAARWAQRTHGIERVAIIDWDVHHGNGTEEIFLDDPSVLTISLHQDGLYPPGRGGLDSQGAGGANINVPLPPGTGNQGYALALAEIVEPAVRAFEPGLILLAAGQDASATDPLGRMAITVQGYRALTDAIVALAGQVCGGRLVAALEGGYSLLHLPVCNLAILEGLAGLAPTFADADPVGIDEHTGLRESERAAVAAARVAYLR